MTSTTSRLLRLLSHLQAGRDWTGPQLAERLGVSTRTVRRDVDRLRELGYRIEAAMGPDGGYRMSAGTQLPPLLFDEDQVLALAVALPAAAANAPEVADGAARALATIRQVMPPPLRHRLDALHFIAFPSTAADGPATSAPMGVLLAISAAIQDRHVLRLDYGDQTAADSAPGPRRRVQPHHLVMVRGRWYLVAWDLDREDWRILRADRIELSRTTGPRFTRREVPGGDVVQFVRARFAGSTETATWPCTGTAVLHLPVQRVVPFVGDGTVEDLGPDRCRIAAGSWSWVALAAWLSRFDCAIDVVEPPELREAFATLAARSLATAAAP